MKPQIFNRVVWESEPKINKKRALKAFKMIAAHELKLRNEGEANMLAKVAMFIQEREWGYNSDIVHKALIDYLKKYDK